MVQTARNNEAERTVDNVAELGRRTAERGVDAAREAADRAQDVARRGFESASELGQAFAELVREQARGNVEVFQALARAVDWDQVSRVQGEFLRASVERAAEFTRRYLEVVQAVTASAVAATREQAEKAA